VDVNVWKVEVKDVQDVKGEQVIVILEAMKLGNSVCAPEDLGHGAKVGMVLVKSGDAIRTGEKIALFVKVNMGIRRAGLLQKPILDLTR
jgi:biotin carboxyl carrier protein